MFLGRLLGALKVALVPNRVDRLTVVFGSLRGRVVDVVNGAYVGSC